MHNFRMTRWEHLKSLIGSFGAARPKRQHHRSGRRPLKWAWSVDGHCGVVTAFTRSHARAEIKRVLGITKGRVPCGACIDRIGAPN
jgi:hypothetical protein